MKYSTSAILVALLSFMSVCPDVKGQWPVVNGPKLEIGPAPVNGTHSNILVDHSGAIGVLNNVSLWGSLAIGNGHDIDGPCSLSVGVQNWVAPEGVYSASIGYANGSRSQCSLQVGTYNSGWANNSLLAGYANVSWGGNSLTVGENCASNSLNGATIGLGLVNTWSYCTVVGHYNDSTISLATTYPLFVVGRGPSAAPTDRKNALEVYQNGKVIINVRQGDILMGEFGN